MRVPSLDGAFSVPFCKEIRGGVCKGIVNVLLLCVSPNSSHETHNPSVICKAEKT
jgi:hypothetical protein